MQNLKTYWNRFLKEEEGFELLQMAIVVLIVAALAVVIWRIAQNANSKLETAEDAIDDIQIDLGGNGGGGGGGTTPGGGGTTGPGGPARPGNGP